MTGFSDRLLASISKTGTPCVVGLDPRPEQIPLFAVRENDVGRTIRLFNEAILDAVGDLVPCVKLQAAFYERFGLEGLTALRDTVDAAKERGLLVLVDAKRNDIASTAEAYADAFLSPEYGFNVDAITVSPFLGRDSLLPFVKACERFERGIFVLVKTSNPGSADLQDRRLEDGSAVYEHLARLVDELGETTVGQLGYSAIGGVVGATFPKQAKALRSLMPKAIILVPGYGAQGGSAEAAAANFDSNGRGAIVNASRSITYHATDLGSDRDAYIELVRSATRAMISDIARALGGDRRPT